MREERFSDDRKDVRATTRVSRRELAAACVLVCIPIKYSYQSSAAITTALYHWGGVLSRAISKSNEGIDVRLTEEYMRF